MIVKRVYSEYEFNDLLNMLHNSLRRVKNYYFKSKINDLINSIYKYSSGVWKYDDYIAIRIPMTDVEIEFLGQVRILSVFLAIDNLNKVNYFEIFTEKFKDNYKKRNLN